MIFWFSSPVFFIGWEVFYQLIFFSSIPPQSSITGLGGFSPVIWSFETHQLLYRARMFSLSPGFPLQVFIRLGGFSPGFHSSTNNFYAQWSSRLRRKAIVMSWSQDLLITWSRHVTIHMICSHPNTWPTNFILTSSHHWYQHLCHHSHVMTISGSLICHVHTTITSSHHRSTRCPLFKDLAWASSRMLWRLTKKTTSRSTPVLDLVVVAWREVPLIAIIKKTTKRSYEWSGKGRRLAKRGLAWPFKTSTSASTMNHHTTQ